MCVCNVFSKARKFRVSPECNPVFSESQARFAHFAFALQGGKRNFSVYEFFVMTRSGANRVCVKL